MERLSMRQNTLWASSGTIIVDVNLSSEPDSHSIYGRVDVYPLGYPPSRKAEAGECIVRLQDRYLGWWRTIEERDTIAWGPVSNPPHDYLGNFLITRSPRLDPGRYRITAQHKQSGAEYAKEFTVNPDYSIGNWSARVKVREGELLSPTFRQFESGPARPEPGIAFPEIRLWPLKNQSGYSGAGPREKSGYTSRSTRV